MSEEGVGVAGVSRQTVGFQRARRARKRFWREPTGLFVLLLAVTSCLPFLGERHDAYYSAWQRIEAVREIAETKRQTSGEYPVGLAEICPASLDRGWPCDSGGSDWWGNALWYEPSGDGYLIGSAGPDGIRGTWDDLDIDSAYEKERIAALAGCYLIEPPRSRPADSDRLLVLDTGRVNLLRAEWEVAVQTPQGFGPPKWHPWRHDSLLVSWRTVGRAVDLRLFPIGDTLTGMVHSPSGIGTWWGASLPFPVRAVRRECTDL